MDCLELLFRALSMQLTVASADHLTDHDAYKDWEACQNTCSKISKTLVNLSSRPDKNQHLYADMIDSYDKLKLMIGRKMFEIKTRMENM